MPGKRAAQHGAEPGTGARPGPGPAGRRRRQLGRQRDHLACRLHADRYGTTISQGGATDQPMQLSIRCRSGRTELVVTGSVSSGNGKDQAISYRIDDKQPVQLAGAQPSFGTGVAFSGDVVRILQSLPEQGELAIRLVSRAGDAKEGLFLLGGLKAARDRLAKVCKWPQTVAGPRN